MARKITVEILADSRNLERSFKSANASARNLSVGIGTLVKSTVVIGGLVTAFRSLSGAVGAGISEFSDQQKVAAQTRAALASTGAAAGVTATQIDKLAGSVSSYSGMDDEAVQAAENMLLTFTKIQNRVGANNDIFTQATKVTADLSVAMGIDMPKAALQVGKALNDPARGYARLQRIGVAFTKTQIDQIKAFTKSGQTAKAQGVILNELTREFGGSAAELGKTVPGQLNIIRETFRNLAGDLVGEVAPAFVGAIGAVSRFASELQEAQGNAERFRIVGDTIRDAATRGLDALRGLGAQLVDRVRAEIDSIDWPKAVGRAGRDVGDALVFALNNLAKVVGAVNWDQVGRRIADGVLLAVVAVAKFLVSVDWTAVVQGLVRALIAVVKASVGLWVGIGKEIARLIFSGVKAGLAVVGVAIERLALNIALKIVEPFTHLPAWLGGPFRDMKADIQTALADIAQTGAAGGKAVGEAITAGISGGLITTGPASSPGPQTGGSTGAGIGDKIKANLDKGTAALLQKIADINALVEKGPAPERKGVTATQRNTFFDNAISRLLNRVQDAPIAEQVGKLKAIGALISQRIAATKDVTRKLNLEDRLLDVNRQIKSTETSVFGDAISGMLDRVQDIPDIKGQIAKLKEIGALIASRIAATSDVTEKLRLEDDLLGITRQIAADRKTLGQNLLDALSFRLDKASATKSQQDDLVALNALQAGVLAQIKVDGRTLDLERQLFAIAQQRKQVNEQIAENRAATRNARQFKSLGLTATGDETVPGVKALKTQLGTIAKAVTGSFLDTGKTRTLMAHLRQVLSGGLGVVGRDVRTKVKGILDDIDKQLKDHSGDQTKFRHVSTSKLLAGLGLSPAELRAVRARVATIGPAGTVPQTSPAFGFAGGGGVTVHGGIHLHGVQNMRQFEDEMEKRQRGRVMTRRGA